MTKEELQWTLLVVSAANIQSTVEARLKASVLYQLSGKLDDIIADQKETKADDDIIEPPQT